MPFFVATAGDLLIGAAVVDAGVNVYNAAQSHNIASSELGMQQTTFGEQQQYEQQLYSLIQNPSSVTSLPGYQFQFDQGTQAVARGEAAGGFLGSGNEATALTQYGQGLATNFYNTQANLLASLAGLAPASPAQYGQNATNAQNSSSNQFNNLLSELGIFYGLSKGSFGAAGGAPGSTPTAPANPGYNSGGGPG